MAFANASDAGGAIPLCERRGLGLFSWAKYKSAYEPSISSATADALLCDKRRIRLIISARYAVEYLC